MDFPASGSERDTYLSIISHQPPVLLEQLKRMKTGHKPDSSTGVFLVFEL